MQPLVTKKVKQGGNVLHFFNPHTMELYHDSTIQLIKLTGFILGFVAGSSLTFLSFKLPAIIKSIKEKRPS